MHNLKKALYCLFFVLIAFFGAIQPIFALEITALRFGKQGSAERIVLDLNRPADFNATIATNPARLVLDIPKLSTPALTGKRNLPPLIKDIRLAPNTADYTRLTFLLNSPASIRTAFLIPSQGQKPDRLVIDLTPTNESTMSANSTRSHGTLTLKTTPQTAEKPKLPFATSQSGISFKPELPESQDLPITPADTRPLIMLDPGHGGHDSGAVGHKIQEKNITLSVALETKKALEATNRYRVALTRQDDRFLSLTERTNLARAQNADLFISIHADSAEQNSANIQGASFYTLSAQASDAAAARLAARENQAGTLAGASLPQNDHDVKNILIDLAMREKTQSASKLARQIAKSFRNNNIATVPTPIRAAGFIVLQAPDIPSVLVELGFLSNPSEAAKLADNAYHATLGKALAEGIAAHLPTPSQ